MQMRGVTRSGLGPELPAADCFAAIGEAERFALERLLLEGPPPIDGVPPEKLTHPDSDQLD